MTKFNERLKAAMAEANLTQAALAGMVDVSKASISTTDGNVWEPGVYGWTEETADGT